MNKLKKILLVSSCIIAMFIFFNSNEIYAANTYIGNIDNAASDFLSKGSKQAGSVDKVTSSITENFKGIGQLLTMIGAGVLVAVITLMGIRYLTATPDKQAALKEQLIGVVVAGLVIFGAVGIWQLVGNILEGAVG